MGQLLTKIRTFFLKTAAYVYYRGTDALNADMQLDGKPEVLDAEGNKNVRRNLSFSDRQNNGEQMLSDDERDDDGTRNLSFGDRQNDSEEMVSDDERDNDGTRNLSFGDGANRTSRKGPDEKAESSKTTEPPICSIQHASSEEVKAFMLALGWDENDNVDALTPEEMESWMEKNRERLSPDFMKHVMDSL